MLQRFTSRLPAIAMAGLLILGLSERAHADLSVTLVGVGTDSTPGNGTLIVNLGPVGGLSAVGAATGETTLGSPAHMDLGTTTITSSAPGTATLIFSMNNITSPVGIGTISEELTAHVITGAATFSLQTFGTNGNVLYTSLPLSPAPTGMTGIVTNPLGGTSTGSFTASAPYTLTEVLIITFTGAGSVAVSTDSSANFTSSPEPSTMAIAGLGSLGFIAYGLRRRKASGA